MTVEKVQTSIIIKGDRPHHIATPMCVYYIRENTPTYIRYLQKYAVIPNYPPSPHYVATHNCLETREVINADYKTTTTAELCPVDLLLFI